MKFWTIGLEWWILYALIIIFIVLVNDLGRTLEKIQDAIKGVHGEIGEVVEELQDSRTNAEIPSVDCSKEGGDHESRISALNDFDSFDSSVARSGR